jgi:hypothetical protein
MTASKKKKSKVEAENLAEQSPPIEASDKSQSSPEEVIEQKPPELTELTPYLQPDLKKDLEVKNKVKTVEVKIALPSLPKLRSPKKIKKKLLKASRKKLAASAVFAIAVISFGGYQAYLLQRTKSGHTAGAVSNSSSLKEPNYPTILPAGKKIEDYGGWTRVSPPDRNPVFAYADNIDNKPINVSEQPLPEDFKNDTAQKVDELAVGYHAIEKVTVGDTVVHIGTSAKGPQSVIFSKKNLLILIKSSVRLDSNEWAKYVNSLQ